MKVDRRSFLGLGLGAAAGIAVSPVGAKLTDDSSIWSQNWPWTPVPPDGKISYDRSVCTLCPGTCGITVRKIDDRPVKIEGRHDYPVNHGGACLHGIAGLQYLYDPSRVQTPLKKIDGRFTPVSWQEALTLVSEKLAAIRKSGTPEKLACITGKDQGAVAGMFKHFLTAFGSPAYLTMPDLESHLARTAKTLHGSGMTLGFDLDHADFVLSFGAGLIEGWGAPVACFKANASRKDRHARLVQIEPRLSNTAAAADRWIPIRPGTEADLAMAMCAVILKENLFDAAYAKGFKGGFMRFNAMLQKQYTPEKVAGITGIPADVIKKTAMAFAKAKMPLAVPGNGRGDGAQSLKAFAAVQMLNCLTGNLNKKGGAFVMPAPDYLSFPDPVLDEVAETGGKKEPVVSVHALVDQVTQSADPGISVLFVHGANPCYALNDPAKVRAAFKKIPFVVSFSSVLDETARSSDLVLPMSTFLERTEDVPSGAGLPRSVVGLAKPMVKRVCDSRAPGDVLVRIAHALGGTPADSFPWDGHDSCLAEVTSKIWPTLAKKGYVVLAEAPPKNRPMVNVGFLADNPESVHPKGSPDLTLVPIHDMRVTGSVPASSPFAVKTVSDRVLSGKDSCVEINPESAKGLKDGGMATVTTAAGSARVRVVFNDGIMPGVIGMVTGLGHRMDNPYIGGKGVNVHELIQPVIEPGSGLDAASGIKAGISKA